MEIHAMHLRYRSLNEFMQIGGLNDVFAQADSEQI
jgi:hypothetical protein